MQVATANRIRRKTSSEFASWRRAKRPGLYSFKAVWPHSRRLDPHENDYRWVYRNLRPSYDCLGSEPQSSIQLVGVSFKLGLKRQTSYLHVSRSAIKLIGANHLSGLVGTASILHQPTLTPVVKEDNRQVRG